MLNISHSVVDLPKVYWSRTLIGTNGVIGGDVRSSHKSPNGFNLWKHMPYQSFVFSIVTCIMNKVKYSHTRFISDIAWINSLFPALHQYFSRPIHWSSKKTSLADFRVIYIHTNLLLEDKNDSYIINWIQICEDMGFIYRNIWL